MEDDVDQYESISGSNHILKRRAEFREKYNTWLSNALVNAGIVVLIFISSLIYSSVNINWNSRAFVVLAIAFIYAEGVFYLTHRFQQHKKLRFSAWVFEMHTLWHHGMFSRDSMGVDSLKDMNMVVLPFFVYAFVLGVLYFPLGYLLDHYFSTDIGWRILLAVTLHFMWYEIVHTLSHLEKPPILKRLAANHREHHNPSLMGQYNFGIATTLFDRLFGTLYLGK